MAGEVGLRPSTERPRDAAAPALARRRLLGVSTSCHFPFPFPSPSTAARPEQPRGATSRRSRACPPRWAALRGKHPLGHSLPARCRVQQGARGIVPARPPVCEHRGTTRELLFASAEGGKRAAGGKVGESSERGCREGNGPDPPRRAHGKLGVRRGCCSSVEFLGRRVFLHAVNEKTVSLRATRRGAL